MRSTCGCTWRTIRICISRVGTIRQMRNRMRHLTECRYEPNPVMKALPDKARAGLDYLYHRIRCAARGGGGAGSEGG